MIEQFRSFVFVLVTVVTVFQCAILPADKTDIRQKRDLDFISNGMKDGLESAGTLVNVGQGVIGKIRIVCRKSRKNEWKFFLNVISSVSSYRNSIERR